MQGAACLCGEELPFLHCHALYAKDLNSRVDVALQKIQGAQESTAYIPVAAQGDTAEQYAGESLPPANTDPYSNTSTAGECCREAGCGCWPFACEAVVGRHMLLSSCTTSQW